MAKGEKAAMRTAARQQMRQLKKMNTLSWKEDWKKNKMVYILFLPVAVYMIVTHYLPMFGVVMAFQDFNLAKGIFGSKFVGWDNFVELFTGEAFLNALKNTFIMSGMSLVIGFLPGLLFALAISEVRNK